MRLNINDEKDPYSLHARLGVSFVFIFVVILFASNIFNIPKYKNPISIPKANSSIEIVRGDISKKQIIFTFDGGSADISTKKVLEALGKHNIKGTFFLTGKFVETFPELTKEIHYAGHEIFNHTYSHERLLELSNIEISRELKRAEYTMKNILGSDFEPRPYFRAPYGDRDSRVLRTAFDEGYQSVFWTVDADDWRESEGVSSVEVENTILSSLAPGNIYLMHLGDSITGTILDEVFYEIKRRGYRIVSLTQGI